jgi:hypothetical protein
MANPVVQVVERNAGHGAGGEEEGIVMHLLAEMVAAKVRQTARQEEAIVVGEALIPNAEDTLRDLGVLGEDVAEAS